MNDVAKNGELETSRARTDIAEHERQRTSMLGIYLIQKREGCRLTAYRCPAGILTIGYGHTGGVKEGDRITQEQAVELLRQDVQSAESALNRMKIKYGVRFKVHEFDALVSFIFNVGVGNFEKSTMKNRQCIKKSLPENQKDKLPVNSQNGSLSPRMVSKQKTSD